MLRDEDGWVATLAMDTSVDMQVRGLLAEVGPDPWTARNAVAAAKGEPLAQLES